MNEGREVFWQNYDVCLKWQERHHQAYWRSKALALEYERDALFAYVEHTSRIEKHYVNDSEGNGYHRRSNSRDFTQFCSSDHQSFRKFKNGGRNRSRTFRRSSRSNKSISNVKDNSEVDPALSKETEVDKDVIEFFKQSMLHKLEMQEKRKASEESDSVTSSSELKRRQGASHVLAEEEMNLLYGEKSAMIRGMETAMQLTFERNCDKLNPVYWPVIPLKS